MLRFIDTPYRLAIALTHPYTIAPLTQTHDRTTKSAIAHLKDALLCRYRKGRPLPNKATAIALLSFQPRSFASKTVASLTQIHALLRRYRKGRTTKAAIALQGG